MLTKIVGLVVGSALRLASVIPVRGSAARRTVRTPTAVVCALAVAALVGGCSGDDAEPSGLPSLTTMSRTSAPSPIATTVPTPRAEARERTSAGAAAFVRFYIALINNAYRTGASGPLRKYAAPSCDSCTSIAAAVDDIYNDGGHAEGGQLSIRQLTASSVDIAIQPTVVVDVVVGTFKEIDAGGTVVDQAHEQTRILLVDLGWSKTWQVKGIRDQEGES